jgi:hypothetical protein
MNMCIHISHDNTNKLTKRKNCIITSKAMISYGYQGFISSTTKLAELASIVFGCNNGDGPRDWRFGGFALFAFFPFLACYQHDPK